MHSRLIIFKTKSISDTFHLCDTNAPQRVSNCLCDVCLLEQVNDMIERSLCLFMVYVRLFGYGLGLPATS